LVPVDEKWFFITEKELHLYNAPDEDVPNRFVVNKDHIIKVMFLCAVARPHFNPAGECIFDGKIGLFPFVERVQAQRASVNHPRGAPTIIRCVQVTKD
jgi:hypothetical protein